MMRLAPLMRIALALLASAWATSPDFDSLSSEIDLAFVNVNVVDVEGGRVLPGQTVLIEGNRIHSVEGGGDVPGPEAALIIDGADQYLIPGLVDMHVHLFNNVSRRDPNTWAFPLFVANGVLGVREMWTEPASMATVQEWRRGVMEGILLAPRVLAAGAPVDGPGTWWANMPEIATPAEGRHFVRSAADGEVDFIKVYALLKPAVYAAILDEASNRGLPVDGHMPLQVRALSGAEAGQRTNEHLYQVREACTTIEDQLLTERRCFYSAAYSEDEEADLLDGQVNRSGEFFDATICCSIAAGLTASGQWQVPTLANERRWMLGVSAARTPERDPRLAYAPLQDRETWMRLLESGSVTYSGDGASLRRSWERTLQVVGILEEAGGRILAGTDFGQPFVLPGFNLHDELALLVEAGLTPAQALQAATSRPARALEMTDSLGSVAPGRLADLVLLTANPLEDIHSTKRIAGVVLNGRHFDRLALDALLEEAVNQDR